MTNCLPLLTLPEHSLHMTILIDPQDRAATLLKLLAHYMSQEEAQPR